MGTLFFIGLLVVFGGANLLWWQIVDRRLRRWGLGRWWRAALAAFVAGMLAYVGFVGTLGDARAVPMPIHVFAYLWDLMVLPGALLCMGVRGVVVGIKGLEAKEADANGNEVSRRRVLGMAVAAVPPVVALGLTGLADAELGTFRIRRTALAVPGLPMDLDGITLAHVTDVHIGRFLPAGTARKIVEAVRELSTDVVVFTGDALDASQREIGPVIEFLRALRPAGNRAYGIIEGNHDVSHGARWFESTVLSAGLPLLLDSSITVRLAGRATPIWLGGITWGKLVPARELGQLGVAGERLTRRNTDATMADSVAALAAQRRASEADGAFPILLVHHPHAFDSAAKHGFPLVLAGHTHGGQIMLTRNIGAGPLRFRYWSGTHQIGDSTMVISNGVGNWFPLRINAPTEIVHITLRAKPPK